VAESPKAEPPVHAVEPPAAAAQPVTTGNDVLDAFLRQLDADPENDVLRLSVARVVSQIGMVDLAAKQYRHLVRHNRQLDSVVGELQDLIANNDDQHLLQTLHRVLGDAYSKQGRLREAIEEYSWTLGGPRGAR
jgi:tetratricopeptide (TPR) repeat protein